jgi:hypothetical protein
MEVPRGIRRCLDIDKTSASHEIRSPESEGNLGLKENPAAENCQLTPTVR